MAYSFDIFLANFVYCPLFGIRLNLFSFHLHFFFFNFNFNFLCFLFYWYWLPYIIIASTYYVNLLKRRHVFFHAQATHTRYGCVCTVIPVHVRSCAFSAWFSVGIYTLVEFSWVEFAVLNLSTTVTLVIMNLNLYSFSASAESEHNRCNNY